MLQNELVFILNLIPRLFYLFETIKGLINFFNIAWY